jgi:hypothetical protein
MSKARDLADRAGIGVETDILYSSTPPTSPSTGTIWTDTTDAEAPILKVYDGNIWLEISGAGGGGGLKSTMMLMGV